MAGRTTRVLDVEDVLWQLENEKFIPEDDSDNDNLENSDFSEEEDILESQSDEVLEDDEPSTSTAPPRRRGGRSAWAGARKRARRSSTTRSGGIRPSYNWTKSFTGRTIRPFEGQRRVRNRQLNETRVQRFHSVERPGPDYFTSAAVFCRALGYGNDRILLRRRVQQSVRV
uniref:uncharacterized protein LOC120334830 n=1 Tax=Styela clava TaxID=7725 RepID=UPI001939AD89|nr:uncharacterized protein LOC120334830 [Styela clava]